MEHNQGASSPQKRGVEEGEGDVTLKKLKTDEEDSPVDKTNGHGHTPAKTIGSKDEKLPAELKAMFEPNICKLCNVTLSSNITAYSHYHGKTHAKNVKTYLIEHQLPIPADMATPKKSQGNIEVSACASTPSDEDLPAELKAMFLPLECKLCNVISPSPIPAHDHYRGKNHNKKVKEYLLSHRPKPELKDETEKTSLSCALCKVSFTSLIHANQHYIGKKHQAKLKSGPDNAIPVPKADVDPSGRFGIGEAFLL